MNNAKTVSFRTVGAPPKPGTKSADPKPVQGEVVDVDTVTGGGGMPAVAATVAYDPKNPTGGNAPVPYVPPSTDRQFSPDNLDDIFELRLPALNIVQGVGALSAAFTPGQIVLNKLLALADPPPKQPKDAPQVPIAVVLIGSRAPVFVQKLTNEEYGSNTPQARFPTERAVFEAGGTTDYGTAQSTGRPLFERLVSVLAIVRKPEDCEDLSQFPIVVKGADGKPELWGAAIIHFRGVQYNNAFTTILTARRTGTPFDLRTRNGQGGFHNRTLLAGTAVKTFQGGKSCFIWSFRDGGPANAEVVAEGYALIGQPSPIAGVTAPSQREEAPEN